MSFSHGGNKFPYPNTCPVCHYKIPIGGYSGIFQTKDKLQVIYVCTNKECGTAFMQVWENYGSRFHLKTTFPSESEKEFSESVKKLSPQFVEIYKQAAKAKDLGLVQICGPGYRKAFEFLIKDYAKYKNAQEAESIEKSFAGGVVEKYIDHPQTKALAKRALWVGNDETHYRRKWEDKDINDLIKLIDLTIHWIEMEDLGKEYVEEMPEK